MTGIRIRAKTAAGQEAIMHVLKADNGRTEWQAFFTETFLSKKPYDIKIEHRNALARRSVPAWQLIEVVLKQLEKNAERGVDFEVDAL